MLRCKEEREFPDPHKGPVRILIVLPEVGGGDVRDHKMKQSIVARWRVADPGRVIANERETRQAFDNVFRLLRSRVEQFLALPFERLNDLELAGELARIGEAR
jgi:arsenate reductase (thioredoxin)